MSGAQTKYGDAIRHAHEYLLQEHDDVFCIGQGLWSPWYVGNTMLDLDKQFGRDRVIDTPVSELACTGAAIGASLAGKRPLVVHPRMDFMLLAVDQIVNQAAKWSHMLGGKASPAVTIRSIVNRGGEQGAQHSQALHAWFAHVPGLRVVMPATPADARDLLIASVLDDSPVLYIDDRWLYDREDEIGPVEPVELARVAPVVRTEGEDVTIVAASYSCWLAEQAAQQLREDGVAAEVIDLRVINPLDLGLALESVRRTGRLVAVDGGWGPCGLAGEVIAGVVEGLEPGRLRAAPRRVTLPFAPAPASRPLEAAYYPAVIDVVRAVQQVLRPPTKTGR